MRHFKVSAKSDGGDVTLVLPSDWNDEHLPEDGRTKPDSAGTYDEEFEGTADTLPTNWSWISTPSTWKLNSQWRSWLIVDHPSNTSETKELRRASFTPGAVDFGLWWHWNMGLGQWNNNQSTMRLDIMNSGETEGVGMRVVKSSVMGLAFCQVASSTPSDIALENGSNNDTRADAFMGVTRTSGGSWMGYISSDGISWVNLGGAHSHSFTADRIRIQFNSGSNVGVERHCVDFVRYRSDLLLWAPR